MQRLCNRVGPRAIAAGRKPPKLVHNLVFSMPKETPPDKLLRAVRKFSVERFALQHRYAMALHTDQANPHVHVVVKAVSEQGKRLNIRKSTLREWRQDFAKYLREYGVEANATERRTRRESTATEGWRLSRRSAWRLHVLTAAGGGGAAAGQSKPLSSAPFVGALATPETRTQLRPRVNLCLDPVCRLE